MCICEVNITIILHSNKNILHKPLDNNVCQKLINKYMANNFNRQNHQTPMCLPQLYHPYFYKFCICILLHHLHIIKVKFFIFFIHNMTHIKYRRIFSYFNCGCYNWSHLFWRTSLHISIFTNPRRFCNFDPCQIVIIKYKIIFFIITTIQSSIGHSLLASKSCKKIE